MWESDGGGGSGLRLRGMLPPPPPPPPERMTVNSTPTGSVRPPHRPPTVLQPPARLLIPLSNRQYPLVRPLLNPPFSHPPSQAHPSLSSPYAAAHGRLDQLPQGPEAPKGRLWGLC